MTDKKQTRAPGQKMTFRPMTDETLRLRQADRRAIWHPFTQMRDWMAEQPLIISRAEGNWLIDSDGNRFLDGVASLWTNVHGHGHPTLNAAIREQLDRVAHSTLLGLAGQPAIEAAEALLKIVPANLQRVFYSDNGSTAVEVAVKMAFQFHQQAGPALGADPGRTRIMAFSNAYHGDTLGSVSLGGMDLFHALYRPLLFEALRAPAPYCYRCPQELTYPACSLACLGELEKIFARQAGCLAAAVVEPLVQGAAGILVQPPGWLKGLAELCRKYNVFLIADEVAVGFGKTGTMFACEQEGVEPDILCLAKGLSGGYLPLAATLTTERIHEGFLGQPEQGRTFFHGHTFTGNPLACAAALASLAIFEQERTMERLGPKIVRLTRGLERFWDIPQVGDIRQKGFMVGLELVKDRVSKEPFAPELRVGHQVILAARNYGVILRPLGDVIVLMPPLSISEEEIDLMLAATACAITETCRAL